ncbi:Crp/Fnr family transcriptional regulator [Actinotalea sp. K2]|uniref:Crp/Fnr family transcriptional regulator n=1 Tax=Actinotalea sp. K2 TaxID=2939438 RepID=UPI002016E2FB|nr:Crp/Fnr family transcriptional regulator [Actinotalea sp. K2]MCL3862881.1 Crp/Fnr family transcriptional regulator [Actinotalea sp. K2]
MAATRRTTPLARPPGPHSCPRPVRLDVLARAPYFAGLSPEALDAVERRTRERAYGPGETVHRIGDDAGYLFVLASGQVKVVRPATDSQDVLVDVVSPGGLVGSLAALGDTTYPDTAETLTPACALSLSAADFRAVLREHPQVALAVLDDVARRLEQAHDALRRMAGASVESRVASTLLTLARAVGEERPGGGTLLQVPLTRTDLASMTGATPESVSRVMSRLRGEGIIDTGRRWTALVDHGRLTRLAGTP